MRAPRVPEKFGKAGRALWVATTRDYALNPAELAALEQCCRVSDLLVRVDEDLAEDLTCEGSVGQVRAHPLLRHRIELTQLLDGLLRSVALPVGDEEEGRRRSPAAVAAARARWGQHGSAS
jgi:hypothetical protein